MADFAVDFLADFTGFFGGFSGRFSVEFLVDFPVDFAWKRRRIFLENFLKPCETKSLRNFLQNLWVRKSGSAIQILGVAGRHATIQILRGMLVCQSFSAYITFNLQGAAEQFGTQSFNTFLVDRFGWTPLPFQDNEKLYLTL